MADLATRIMLEAIDQASTVIAGMGAGFDSTVSSMADATATLDASMSVADESTIQLDADMAALQAVLLETDGLVADMDASLIALAGSIGDAALAMGDLNVTVGEAEMADVAAAAAADQLAASQKAAALAAKQNAAAMKEARDAAALQKEEMSGAMSVLTPVAIGLAAVGIAAIGVGVASTIMAGNFQSGITTLVTGAGEFQSNIDLISQGILQMSVDVGTSTKQLIAGMFMIESAGYRGGAALDVLRTAAEGAKVGNADLGVVANALTTVMKDYGISAKNSADAMNFLTAIVQNGKTTLQDLASSMSQVLPAASAVGVSLVDVGAAMATMTAEGVPAANAATYLRQMVIALAAPAKGAQKALAEIGLTSAQVSAEMKKSLPGALQMIMDHLKATYKEGSPQYVEALKSIAGGSKQMQGMLDLTGIHLKEFQANVKNVADTMKAGHGSVVGWTLVQQDFNFKMDQAKAAIEAVFIVIGTQLLPILGPLVSSVANGMKQFAAWLTSTNAIHNAFAGLAPALAQVGNYLSTQIIPPIARMLSVIGPLVVHVAQAVIASGALQMAFGMVAAALPYIITGMTTLVTWLAQLAAWIASNEVTLTILKGVMIVIGAVIIGVLVVAFVLLAVQMAVVILAVGLLILMLALLFAPIIAIVLLIMHWGQVAHWLQGVWAAFASWFMGILGDIGAFFVGIWNAIASFFVALWNATLASFQTMWNAVVAFVTGAIQAIVRTFQWMYAHNYIFQALVDFIMGVFNWLKTGATVLWTMLVSYLTAKWQQMVADAQTIWGALVGFFSWLWGVIWGALVYAWNAVVNFLVGVWNTIVANVKTAWQNVSNVFASAWSTYIAGPLTSFGQMIAGFFTALAQLSISWGVNLMKGFISGITSQIQNLKNTVGQVIGTVGSILGFHSPAKEGEGRHIIEWGANMVAGFNEGVISAIPHVKSTMNMVMAPIASTLGTPVAAGGGGGTTHHHYHATINIQSAMLDRSGVQRVAGQLADEVDRQLAVRYGRQNTNGPRYGGP